MEIKMIKESYQVAHQACVDLDERMHGIRENDKKLLNTLNIEGISDRISRIFDAVNAIGSAIRKAEKIG